MISDTERREVARRLRELNESGICVEEQICDLREIEGGAEFRCDERCDKCRGHVLAYLADLIEPNRGSGLCAHCESASWCGCEPGDEEGGCAFEPSVTEGEPPYNLYSLYEAIFRRHPRDKYAIEDDEVDELVDALLDICNAPGHECIQRPQPSEPKVRCVAEVKVDGKRLEGLVHDAAVELTGVDRDALLELAEDVAESAAMAVAIDSSERTKLLADMLLDIARRIREACGEVES